jgi:nucleotide-binding universal stress UspA family protein
LVIAHAGTADLAPLRALAERDHPTLPVHSVATPDHATDLLRDLAVEAELVVVGSHGRGPIGSVLLGSVSASLVRAFRSPLVVVRPHHPGTVRRGVLVGIDLTEHSSATLEFAFHEAALHDWPLTVLYVAVPPDPQSLPRRVPHNASSTEWRALSELCSGLREKYPDVSVTLDIVRGVAGDFLVEAARDRHLVVLGRRGRGHTARFVLERTDAAVAVVPA